MKKKILIIIAILVMLSTAIFAVGCKNKDRDGQTTTLTELAANKTLVVGDVTFKNSITSEITEQYLTKYKSVYLQLNRSNYTNSVQINGKTYNAVQVDGYYYYWTELQSQMLSETVSLGTKIVTVEKSYDYSVYAEDSIYVRTTTKTTTSYSYESQIVKATPTATYYLGGYFGTYEVDDLDTATSLPMELKGLATAIVNGYRYVVDAPSKKTVTTYNSQTYTGTYFYLTKADDDIKTN